MEVTNKNHIATKESISNLNLSPVLNECIGDLDLVQELVMLFNMNVLEFIGMTKVYIKNEDFESLKFSVHKVKMGLKMIKIEALHSWLLQMEATIVGDEVDTTHLNYLYEGFTEEYAMVEEQLARELERLSGE